MYFTVHLVFHMYFSIENFIIIMEDSIYMYFRKTKMTYQIKGHASMCYSGGRGQDHVLWIDYSLSSVASMLIFYRGKTYFHLRTQLYSRPLCVAEYLLLSWWWQSYTFPGLKWPVHSFLKPYTTPTAVFPHNRENQMFGPLY